ncbi:MAG: acetylxylan esterase, partial [Pirellulaceae bacterium]|nr:acetylxylan esterase [Pirellulaceae bacterium]
MILIVLLVLLSSCVAVAAEEKVPTTFAALWADVDPTAEPLEIKLVREWQEEGLVLRYVTYHVGTFKGKPARVAAFYAFPRGARKLPGLVHLHGGGQRAFLHEVKYYAQRGYACLSINWGGREMEDAKAGDANTDWGAVDPTQKNVPGYANLKPGPLYLDPVESPRNNNWYLLTLASRRGLTFLEQQPEVDPRKLGVYGHSMGGNLTLYVAGTDKRVKASAPSGGGQG